MVGKTSVRKKQYVTLCRWPKTEHNRCRVAMTPMLALYLREYKAERERLYSELGKPLTLDNLVFTSIEGEPINSHILSRAFDNMAKKAGLGHVRFHDLRHTFASLMLQARSQAKGYQRGSRTRQRWFYNRCLLSYN